MMHETWHLSYDGENWEPDEYTSRNSAIIAAPDRLVLCNGMPFFVGRRAVPDPVIPPELIGQAGDDAIESLEEELAATFARWCHCNGVRYVVDVEQHTAHESAAS